MLRCLFRRRSAFLSAVRLAAMACTLPVAASGQEPPPASSTPPATQAAPERNDPDVLVDPLQPDFTLGALPTTLRMPKGKFAFRVTHRFTRDLGEGDFGDTIANLFGLDGGSQVGLEVRYGLLTGTQIGVHRTSDRSTELFAQHNFMNQRDGGHFGLDAIATFEGEQNLTEHHQSALGLVISRNLGRRAAVYAEPLFVINSNPFEVGDEHTAMIGLARGCACAARCTCWRSTRRGSPATGRSRDQILFAFETRAGGHLFQINVSNGFGTTLGQVSRGGVDYDQWYLGFNLSRKFF